MGWTPLTFAASTSNNYLLKELIRAGANLNNQEADGWTPLMFCAFRGNEECITALVEAGADLLLTNNAGLTAHELARMQSHETAAIYLGEESVFYAMTHESLPDMM